MDGTQNATKTDYEHGRRGFSVRELAAAYGVSPGLVRLEIARKRLRGSRIGRRVVILAEAVEDWLRLAAGADDGR